MSGKKRYRFNQKRKKILSQVHNNWYVRFFSDPLIIKQIVYSFVHEPFVEELDFSTLKKLNTKFIAPSEKSRQADIVYEVKSKGQTSYLYLFLEFQSTVDHFMALRMARYVFEFYQEIQILTKEDRLNPSFPILIYNGNATWTAPEKFSQLLYSSSIPKAFLPEFRYFKIAINKISKRDLQNAQCSFSSLY